MIEFLKWALGLYLLFCQAVGLLVVTFTILAWLIFPHLSVSVERVDREE